jgi:protein-L-isoaspartate(D-aspartate) O-methyltransferase
MRTLAAPPEPATAVNRPELDPPDARDLRSRLVAELAEAGDVKTERVRRALLRVPRHLFVPRRVSLEDAYANRPLPIGHGQTISQPAVVAWMTDALELSGGERVLEIGTGSAYQAAVLSILARRVYSVELVPELAERSGRLLRDLGYDNVLVARGDGALGWASRAPFDRVIAAAATPLLPQAWLDQMGDGAILVAPLGDDRGQMLVKLTRHGDSLVRQDLGLVSFVPLLSDDVGTHRLS